MRQINERNENDHNTVQDMSLKSKAELQLTRNKLHDLESEIEQLKREIQDKQTQFNN